MGVSFNGIMDDVSEAAALAVAPTEELGPFKRPLQSAIQAVCNGYSTLGLDGTPLRLNGAAFLIEEVCAPYYAQNGYTGPKEQPPFNGGQCSTTYRVTASGQYQGETRSLDAFIQGPIGSRRVVLSGGTFNGEPAYSTQYQNGSGGWSPVGFSNMSLADANTWKIVTAIRLDGNPDSCGNPPAQFVPGTAPTYNYGDEYEYNVGNGNSVNISVGAPTVNVDGRLSVPINIGGIQVVFPEGAVPESNPSGANSPPPVGSGPAIPGPALEEAGGDFGEPPAGTEWVGAILEVTAVPPGVGRIAGTPPNVVFPQTVGNFRLKLRSEDGNNFLSDNKRVREDASSLFRANDGVAVTGAIVNLMPEFAYEVTPLFADLPDD